jgi:hypothetical protein
VLKKAYLKYGEVAGKDVQYIFFDLFKDYREFKAETLSSTCFMNDGHGGFTNINLPDELQLAPVFSFAPMPGSGHGYIAVGNFYGVVPYEGRYDALRPTLFNYDATEKKFVISSILPAANGEIRDAQWIKLTGNQQLLLLARNNSSILFYKPNNQ